MRPHFPRFSLRSRLGLGCVLLAAGLLGACDRHSATDVPESYGHGSAHQRNYDNHQLDSLRESKSFSDTQGLPAEGGSTGPGEAPKSAPVNSSPNPKPSKRFGFGGY